MESKSPEPISLSSEIQQTPTVSDLLKLDAEAWTDEYIDAMVELMRERRKLWEQEEGKAKREGKRTPRKAGASQVTLADLEIDLGDLDV